MQKLLYLWNSRVEKPVFSLIAGWIVGGESLLAFVSPYISSLPPPGSRSFAVKRQLSYFIAAFAVLFQKIYIYIARINEKRKEGKRDRIK